VTEAPLRVNNELAVVEQITGKEHTNRHVGNIFSQGRAINLDPSFGWFRLEALSNLVLEPTFPSPEHGWLQDKSSRELPAEKPSKTKDQD